MRNPPVLAVFRTAFRRPGLSHAGIDHVYSDRRNGLRHFFCTFYVGLTRAAKPVAARARLTYLVETLVSARSEADSLPARVKRFFGALETLDADAVASFFAVGATVKLPGLSPILGRAAIRRALVRLSLDVDDLRHAPVQLWTAGNVSVFEADMTLTLADHTTFAFPVTHIVRWVDGMIEEASVNVYLESRMAVAMSAFDRWRNMDRPGGLSYPNHKSMGRLTPAGRNGSSILRPCPADA